MTILTKNTKYLDATLPNSEKNRKSFRVSSYENLVTNVTEGVKIYNLNSNSP